MSDPEKKMVYMVTHFLLFFISLIVYWILPLTLTFEDVFYRNDDIFADASHRSANKYFHQELVHKISGL